MAAVLAVEDDVAQRRLLSASLGQRGHRVVGVGSGRDARRAVDAEAFDVVLVDLGLPDIDGVDLCGHLRVWPGCPIIVVSGDDSDERMVEALRSGADDYVVKPYGLDVLAARIDVQLRNVRRRDAKDVGLLHLGDVRLDPAGHAVEIGGVPRALHAQQFHLLRVLMDRAGQLVTYDELGRSLGRGEHTDVAALRTGISRLRRELGSGPARPIIAAERHLGYRLRLP